MNAQPFGKSNTNFVRYPRFKELHKEIQRCQELSKVSLEPQCMSLEGESGTGKSTLVKDYAHLFPRYETESGIVIPVYYAEIPSPATVKGTASGLLEQLGDPGANKGTLWSMNSRLVGLIKSCGVELVILDEFSNLIDTETNHVMNTVSDWLKMLIKQSGVPFLVVGISGKVSRILKANNQLARLFACREQLEPFIWGDSKSIQDFSMFVQYAEKAVGLPFTKDVPKVELYYRLHYATDGVVGNIMNLVRYAGLNATENNCSSIDLRDLSEAFRQRLSAYLPSKVNPFTLVANEGFNPPVDKKTDQSDNRGDIGNTLTTR
jgi:hypothetical protein